MKRMLALLLLAAFGLTGCIFISGCTILKFKKEYNATSYENSLRVLTFKLFSVDREFDSPAMMKAWLAHRNDPMAEAIELGRAAPCPTPTPQPAPAGLENPPTTCDP